MTDLITRLAQADKPTRELLWEAWQAINGTIAEALEMGVSDFAVWHEKRRPFDRMLDAEARTSAVEMLVPPEYARCYASGWGVDGRGFATIGFDRSIYALHPVNALAIACLKARGL